MPEKTTAVKSAGAEPSAEHSGGTARNLIIQPKLTIGSPNDHYEQQADQVADRVMRMAIQNDISGVSSFSVQRKCAACAHEEEQVQRKPFNITPFIQKSRSDGGGMASDNVSSQIESARGGGSQMGESTRSFMESRFGNDFSGVRIHTDANAIQLSQNLDAQAFTVGHDVFFNEGKYSPETDSGKHLLAHELVHTVQQGNNIQREKIQRAVGKWTNCPSDRHSAPHEPLTVLAEVNEKAANLALGASHILFSDSLFMQSAEFGSSGALNLYRQRFGDPVLKAAKFKNRFTASLHKTLLLAQASEMQFLSDRLAAISKFLRRNIHFKCGSTQYITIGNCAPFKCTATAALGTCPGTDHGNSMIVCPAFWGLADINAQALGMIHEISHMYYKYGDHDTKPYAQTDAQRKREPECYASLVADIHSLAALDVSCPIKPI